MEWKRSRPIQVALIIGAILIVSVWELGIVPAMEKGKTYTGDIVDLSKHRKWWKGFKKPMSSSGYRYYNYTWVIACDNGDEIEVEIPHFKWKKGEAGLPVKKVKGQRYPVVDTQAAEAQRHDSKKALDMVFGK